MSAAIAVLLWILGGVLLAVVEDEMPDAPRWAALLRCAIWPLLVFIECYAWLRESSR